MRARRTQPKLPGVTLPTASIDVQSRRSSALPQPKSVSTCKARAALAGWFRLLLALDLGMYPLLAVMGLNKANAAFPGCRISSDLMAPLVQGLHHILTFDLSRRFANDYCEWIP
jgi:hypothetical protein